MLKRNFLPFTCAFVLAIAAFIALRVKGEKKFGFMNAYFQVGPGVWQTLFYGASSGLLTTQINPGHTFRINTGAGIYTLFTGKSVRDKYWYFK